MEDRKRNGKHQLTSGNDGKGDNFGQILLLCFPLSFTSGSLTSGGGSSKKGVGWKKKKRKKKKNDEKKTMGADEEEEEWAAQEEPPRDWDSASLGRGQQVVRSSGKRTERESERKGLLVASQHN
ncbi:hypothetical protein RIB2604_02902230 [Aspergillus luchuensis]|uniref:Uncharacterized protein n=1 Tax=Aspergillus kawachii TaxID=1069201 RepID=A0A146FX22_ASPKA|nr:hypothetical protein AKAW_07626 [Aspergillus luchuensis IFO 4308]GAT29351.1 hypothetical protein RIB2604_02902230 [Aspergillus luchuensis]